MNIEKWCQDLKDFNLKNRVPYLCIDPAGVVTAEVGGQVGNLLYLPDSAHRDVVQHQLGALS